jgi:dienelactone hydrolase
VNGLSEAVRASGSNFELFEYEGSAHLFADSDFADYDAEASQLMFERMLAFLQRVSRHERR